MSRQSALNPRGEPHGEVSPIPLRLIATRGGVGIELYQPQAFGPLSLVELSWLLPGLSFPLDLSGGVREFRHRRGEVVRAVVQLEREALARWLRSRLSRTLGGLEGEPSVWTVPAGLAVGVCGAEGAVAFELLWAPAGERARFVISEPRVAGRLAGPAIAHAFAIVDSALGKLGVRRGRIIDLGPVLVTLTRGFLPALGVRVPTATQVWFSPPVAEDAIVSVVAERNPQRMELQPEALRALEFAELVVAGDEALVSGDPDAARAEYMTALEAAPRHPELCRTIASIDKDFEERSEAALGLLVEALPATAFGLVGAELLSRVGDEQGAEVAIRQAAQRERYAPLAALLWCRLSELSSEMPRKVAALDHALAVSPASKPARWARFALRLTQGDLNGAVADAEHLEAATKGSAGKHLAIITAAKTMQAQGYVHPARRLFERALRYLPKDAEATLGLAQCFLADGGERRALSLLRRAAELTAAEGPVYSLIQLELGKLLARSGKDLPQAIARVRRVSVPGPLLVEARALEGRWRARLGDLSGASIAFGKLAAAVEMTARPDEQYAPLLLEAAQFSREQGDVRSAERQLSLALSVAPNHPKVLAGYREVAAQLAATKQDAADDEAVPATTQALAEPTVFVSAAERAPLAEAEASEPEPVQVAEDEFETDALELSQQLMAGARLTDHDFGRLEKALSALHREAELHALLWARFEDADDTVRGELRPRLVRVLHRLAEQARYGDAAGDAELYEAQLRDLESTASDSSRPPVNK